MRNAIGFGCALALAFSSAAAQNYPEKPVTIVAPFPAGGSVDLVTAPGEGATFAVRLPRTGPVTAPPAGGGDESA